MLKYLHTVNERPITENSPLFSQRPFHFDCSIVTLLLCQEKHNKKTNLNKGQWLNTIGLSVIQMSSVFKFRLNNFVL